MQRGFAPILVIILIAAAVGGYFVYSSLRGASETSNVAISTTPVSNPSPTTSGDTTNWKTYTNNKFGFSIQYPSDWITQDIEYKSNGPDDTAPSYIGVGLRPAEPQPSNEKYTLINIAVFNNPNNLSLDEFVKDWYSFSTEEGKLSISVINGESIVVGGVTGKEIINPPIDSVGLPVTWVLIGQKEKVYRISVILYKSYPKIDKQRVFDQILSTFKFT